MFLLSSTVLKLVSYFYYHDENMIVRLLGLVLFLVAVILHIVLRCMEAKESHQHAPGKQKYRLCRFAAFLISPGKVYRYCRDGIAVCGTCGANLLLPEQYYSVTMKVLYGLCGVIAGTYMGDMQPYMLPVGAVLLLVFHYIATAFVFTMPWEGYSPERYEARYARARSAKDTVYKALSLYLSYCIVILGSRLFK